MPEQNNQNQQPSQKFHTRETQDDRSTHISRWMVALGVVVIIIMILAIILGSLAFFGFYNLSQNVIESFNNISAR